MRDQSIVILSSDDWGWKTSKYQLSTRFAQRNRVLFVSSIGFRAPSASRSDLARLWRKLLSFFKGPRSVGENIWVLTPIVIPFGSGTLIRWLNRYIFALQYRFALRWLRLDRPYLFVFSPNWQPYIRSLRHRKLIYYCVDDQSGFKGVDAARFNEWDTRLTLSADCVFCSASMIYKKKRTENRDTHYLPHGVNWTLFSRALAPKTLKPDPTLAQLEGPILLFFGHISHDWVDVELLRFVASTRPNWHIALVGRSSVSKAEFGAYPNVHLLGERDYEELPALCQYASAGIIPFVNSELTAACNPLKLYEYLAAGLPVVSTDIPEVRRYSKMVLIGVTPDAFLAACDKALLLDRADYSRKASDSVREHDWDSRVERIYALIAA